MGQRIRAKIPESDILTEQMLAQKLKVYGLRPKTVRIGEQTARGYLQTDIGALMRRYVPLNDVRPYFSDVKPEEEEG
jgi:hypothetical protein